MLIRVRSPEGQFRIDVAETDLMSTFKRKLEEQTKVPVAKQRLTREAAKLGSTANDFPRNEITMKLANLKHGDMLFLAYDKGVLPEAPSVASSSSSAPISSPSSGKSAAALEDDPSLALKDIKRSWTLSDYLARVERFTIRIKAQPKSTVRNISLDYQSANAYQAQLRSLGFQVQRMGYLLGSAFEVEPTAEEKEEDEKERNKLPPGDENKTKPAPPRCEVEVDAIYEPPQESSPEGVAEKADPEETKVDSLSELLGMRRVGWIFSHAKRELPLDSSEVLYAAALQSKYGRYFVTVTMAVNEEGMAQFEAFQVSDQCVQLYEQGLLLPSDNPKCVKTKRPVIVEAKEVSEVDVSMFITTVAIKDRRGFLLSSFPRANRPLLAPGNMADVKRHLEKYKAKKFHERIADFHLLLFLSNFLDMNTDLPFMCEGIKHGSSENLAGFEELIKMYCEGQ